MSGQKTYSHLLAKKRMPTDYELVTSQLLYYPKMGSEVNVPIKNWYEKNQTNSPFKCSDWEKFYDPRETTYTKYTEIQKSKEIFVDGILKSIEDLQYDSRLTQGWIKRQENILPALRFPFHGFQMISSYVGQMAPGGRIVIVSLMQAADEMRRVQRIAYRMRQLQNTHSDFGKKSQVQWQSDPLWQPLRRVIEKLLVTYDWGEAFVGLNLCLKPLVDDLFMTHFSHLARGEEDSLLGEIFYSLNQDCQWSREWSQRLVNVAIDDTPENKEVIQRWVDKWCPLAVEAIEGFELVFGGKFKNVLAQIRSQHQEFLKSVKLTTPAFLEGRKHS